MKIGLLAYHSAINFGATLQLLSTYMYLIKKGHNPIIINWIPDDLADFYKEITPQAQIESQEQLRKSIWKETELCKSSQDVADVLIREHIEAVIIGSDAVAQHHPLLERIVFPCRTIIGINKNTTDNEYPNPFWATWLSLLPKRIPVALLSASCQDSAYKLIPPKIRKEMNKRIYDYSYISVRDEWTKNMISYITKQDIIPPITPDPVFAFNQNAGELIASKEDILKKYDLPENYFVLSFLNKGKRTSVDQKWINEFETIVKANNAICVSLPFSHKEGFGNITKKISLPLSPLDWYGIIKYSKGYIGNNMHPIVVCLHNNIPFYSFDNYGRGHFNGLITSDSSSKIKHIITKAHLSKNRTSCMSYFFKAPAPLQVFSAIKSFDYAACDEFRKEYSSSYNEMLDNIFKSFGL